jgi:hypothetical protein
MPPDIRVMIVPDVDEPAILLSLQAVHGHRRGQSGIPSREGFSATWSKLTQNGLLSKALVANVDPSIIDNDSQKGG